MLHGLNRQIALLSVFLFGLAPGCDRRLEPYVAPADEPAPLERPVRVPGLENPAPRARMPMGAAEPPSVAEPDVGEPIRGRVVAGDGVGDGGEGVLFVIARGPGGGPPLAVKRLPVGPFPLDFEIGPGDVMIAGRPFRGPISLTARIDRDGNAMTRGPDDAGAELASPVEPGATGLELRLERPDPS